METTFKVGDEVELVKTSDEVGFYFIKWPRGERLCVVDVIPKTCLQPDDGITVSGRYETSRCSQKVPIQCLRLLSPSAPEKPKVEEWECTHWTGKFFTIGKCYKIVDGLITANDGTKYPFTLPLQRNYFAKVNAPSAAPEAKKEEARKPEDVHACDTCHREQNPLVLTAGEGKRLCDSCAYREDGLTRADRRLRDERVRREAAELALQNQRESDATKLMKLEFATNHCLADRHDYRALTGCKADE